jgi:hypothetical protein
MPNELPAWFNKWYMERGKEREAGVTGRIKGVAGCEKDGPKLEPDDDRERFLSDRRARAAMRANGAAFSGELLSMGDCKTVGSTTPWPQAFSKFTLGIDR